MLRNAFASGPVAAIVRGRMQDLTDTIRRVEGEGCEYLRVTVRGYAGRDKGSR